MAGLRQSLRASSSSSSSSSLSLLTSSYSSYNFIYKLFFFLCLIPFFLALFSFFLQWGPRPAHDRTGPWAIDRPQLPGFFDFANPTRVNPSSSDGSPTNVLAQSSSPVFPYFKGWTFDYNDSDLSPKICITTSTSAGIEQVLPWIFYHKVIGISNFFIFVEGNAASPNVSKVLQSIPGVQVIRRTRELEEAQSKSRIWNETWLSSFFYKPCNYELFVKQNFNMEMAIVMARNAGMEWIFHLDTDELIHPAGTKEYSVKELLTKVPEDVDMVVFVNHESAVERDDIREPFSEVSLFKKNSEHLSKETYIGKYKELRHGNPHYFLTYGNGKAAARIQDHLRPNGAHRWHNYIKAVKEMKMDEAAVLHYSYTRFSDLTSRRDRCHCKPTNDDLRRCFMLEFDRNAFVIASTATQEEMLQWYREHVVWNNETLKLKLLKSGVFTRIYTPMVIIEGLRESGVFASVIASVHGTPQDFIETLSNKNNDSIGKSDAPQLPSKKKIATLSLLQETCCKLEQKIITLQLCHLYLLQMWMLFFHRIYHIRKHSE